MQAAFVAVIISVVEFEAACMNKEKYAPASNRRRRCLSGSSAGPGRCQRSSLIKKDKKSLCTHSLHRRVSRKKHFYNGLLGPVHTEAYHRYILPVLPVPDTSVSSVHQQRYREIR